MLYSYNKVNYLRYCKADRYNILEYNSYCINIPNSHVLNDVCEEQNLYVLYW